MQNVSNTDSYSPNGPKINKDSPFEAESIGKLPIHQSAGKADEESKCDEISDVSPFELKLGPNRDPLKKPMVLSVGSLDAGSDMESPTSPYKVRILSTVDEEEGIQTRKAKASPRENLSSTDINKVVGDLVGTSKAPPFLKKKGLSNPAML